MRLTGIIALIGTLILASGCDLNAEAQLVPEAFAAPAPRIAINCKNLLKTSPTPIGKPYQILCRIDNPALEWKGLKSVSCNQPKVDWWLQPVCDGPHVLADDEDPPIELVKFENECSDLVFVYTSSGKKYFEYWP